MHIPAQGFSKQEILSTLQAFKSRDMDWKSGKVWCYVYSPGQDPAEVTREAYVSFLSENGLDPSVFPSLLKLETDVVRATIDLLRGDSNAVGHLTTGGTESIMLAVKTARDKARGPSGNHPTRNDPAKDRPRCLSQSCSLFEREADHCRYRSTHLQSPGRGYAGRHHPKHDSASCFRAQLFSGRH